MKLLKISLLILFVGGVSSCQKYLDVKPYGRVIPKTDEEFSAIIHDGLNTLDEGKENYLLGNSSVFTRWDVGHGDDFELSLSSAARLDKYVGDYISTPSIYSPYRKLYEYIRNSNIVLSEFTTTEGKSSREVRATALALRAVAYYQLMRLYCQAPEAGKWSSQLGLPLPITFDLEASLQRSTLAELIARIEQDLKEAIKLDNQNSLYRFTSDVCRAYLARLYFWTEQWDKALPETQNLLNKYPILQAEDYKQMQAISGELRGNQLIKAYRLVSSNQNEQETNTATVQGRPVSQRLLSLFTEEERDTDVRYKLWFNAKRQSLKNFFCGLRSAELLLIQAECFYHLGQSEAALSSINVLRSARIAGHQAFTLANLPEPSPLEIIKVDAQGQALTPLLALILSERRKELFLEGDRFFELKRNGSPTWTQTYNGVAYTTEPYMYTYPLPSLDVQLSKLEQNPGYTELISE